MKGSNRALYSITLQITGLKYKTAPGAVRAVSFRPPGFPFVASLFFCADFSTLVHFSGFSEFSTSLTKMDTCDGFPTELIRAVNRFRTDPKSVAKYMCDPAYRRDEDPVTKDEAAASFRTFKGGPRR